MIICSKLKYFLRRKRQKGAFPNVSRSHFAYWWDFFHIFLKLRTVFFQWKIFIYEILLISTIEVDYCIVFGDDVEFSIDKFVFW